MGNEAKLAKNSVGDELLLLIDNCIQLAGDSRELAYRVHISENIKAAPDQIKKIEKMSTFATTARDKLLILQSILEDTIESQREFLL